MSVNLTESLPIIISLVAVIFSGIGLFKNSKRANNKEVAQDIAEKTSILVKMDAMARDISEIKNDIRDIKSDMQGLRDRLIIVEQSTKSSHHRIDVLEDRMNKLDIGDN